MRYFKRGSEWRKWDLHVHVVDTQLGNGYSKRDGEIDWDLFCITIHDSEVHAFGITDYFNMDGFYTFIKRYKELYPYCEKVFFPNLELRLNEAVNGATEVVNFHILFQPDIAKERMHEFLMSLKTQITNADGKKKSCIELTADDYSQATVTRDDIKSALKNTYGDEACWKDHVILVAAANNDGIRADNNSMRKMNIADQIDKFADAFFGNSSNTDYFLKTNRYEDSEQKSLLKPVFSGSDPHNFNDLQAWLGKEISDDKNNKCVTWVKADLTFEGLQQTIIEPAERVRIQSVIPDEKEPYRVISKIIFNNEKDFPNEVVFNPGLNAIIGSRSSGKSALLAYIAHAINPEYTVQQQILATGYKESIVGPGASITWNDVKDINYEVEWAEPTTTTGQVIYIPQNSLFSISERPNEITAKIQPVVFRTSPKIEVKFIKMLGDIENKNKTIYSSIVEWFSINSEIKELNIEIINFGDRNAITKRRDDLVENIAILQESSSLNKQEIKRYQQISETIRENEVQLIDIEDDLQILSPYLQSNGNSSNITITDNVIVNISIAPVADEMPKPLQNKLQFLVGKSTNALKREISDAIIDYRSKLDDKYNKLKSENVKIKDDNENLINKNLANTQMATLQNTLNEQNIALKTIDNKTTSTNKKVIKQQELLSIIETAIKTRNLILEKLVTSFNETSIRLEDMGFSLEIDYDNDRIKQISSGFNKNAVSSYIADNIIDMSKVFSNIGAFIKDMANGTQKLNRGENSLLLTQNVLTIIKDVRFVAEMEGDRIGGFKKSSMTPGKQALFALTLILADSEELWPLLIDQPEDDLDSRSICDVIVKDLVKRKRKRQIIMVTHDANLAIGADSEEIIVANRNGDDRPNIDGKLFEYLTGSLEYSKPYDESKYILSSAGIREHACTILDGGELAFKKRKDKYRI